MHHLQRLAQRATAAARVGASRGAITGAVVGVGLSLVATYLRGRIPNALTLATFGGVVCTVAGAIYGAILGGILGPFAAMLRRLGRSGEK